MNFLPLFKRTMRLSRFPGAHGNFAPHQSAEGGTKYKLFFSGTYHISFTPASDGISRSLYCETALPTVEPRELKQPGACKRYPLRRPYPVIPHSCTYATPVRDRGERQSGSATSGAPNTVPWHAEHGISVLEMSLL